MARKLTITIDDAVYLGLYRKVGRRRISEFLEDLARPHVTDEGLEAAYRRMATDGERESEALEWAESLVGDAIDEAR